MTSHAPDQPRQPAQDELQAAGQKIRASGAEAAREAAGEAKAQAEEGKAGAAGRIGDVARATRRAADELEGREDWLADVVGSAASELEGLARGVRDKNVGELVGDLEAFGRRYPTALFGVAAALGFGAVRFARSSERRRHDDRAPTTATGGHGHPAYEAAARRVD